MSTFLPKSNRHSKTLSLKTIKSYLQALFIAMVIINCLIGCSSYCQTEKSKYNF